MIHDTDQYSIDVAIEESVESTKVWNVIVGHSASNLLWDSPVTSSLCAAKQCGAVCECNSSS